MATEKTTKTETQQSQSEEKKTKTVKKEEPKKVETPKKDKKSESAVQKAKKLVDEKKSKKVEKVDKVILEREYIVPLRRGFMKVPRYKRAKKAIKTLREFLAKHMKVENRDLKLIKIDRYLNEEMWFRGIKKPPAKIKIKATKMSSGIVNVELVEVPDTIKFKKAKDEKFHKPVQVKTPKHAEEKKEVTEAEKEKEEALRESSQKANKAEAVQAKHTTKGAHKEKTQPQRKALKR